MRDIQRLEAACAQKGIQFSEPVEQDDQAYAPRGWRYGHTKLGVPFARLRTQSGRHVFTLKQPTTNELDCIEHESEVADREAMHHAVLNMGYYPTVRIRKSRRLARYGPYTLCLDMVDSIGWFLEVEVLTQDQDGASVAQDILDMFVRSLTIPLDRVHQTYDSLLYATNQTALYA